MLSLRKVFLAGTLLCTIMLAAPAQPATTSSMSSIRPANSAITCMPGLVLRCNQFGCFCVRP